MKTQIGAVGATVALAMLALTGCSTTTTGAGTSGATNASHADDPVVADAIQYADKVAEGDFQSPPTTGPAAQTGKNIWFISCGQQFQACVEVGNSLQEAGKQLGWNVTVQDGKSDPSVASNIMRQAVAAKIDGIVQIGYDCQAIKSALLEAKATQIPVVNYAAMDCNDKSLGAGASDPLFAASVKLRDHESSLDFHADWARAGAKYLIGVTEGNANVLLLDETSIATQINSGNAFRAEIATCKTCEVVSVPFTFAQVPNPAKQIWTTAVQSHPKANAVATLIGGMMGLGLVSAVQQSPNAASIILGGDDGSAPNLDLIREGKQTYSLAVPLGWVAWGLADTLNRVFAGETDSFPNQGAGWQLVDKDHNLPKEQGAVFEPSFDYRTVYKSVWNAK